MRLRTSISPANTASPTSVASTRYFSIAASPNTNEPSKVFGSVERDLRRAKHGVEQLLGDDRAADGGQNLLQVLAVDGLHDQALEHKAEGAADQRRQRARRARRPRG